MRESRIQAVDHVHMEARSGLEEDIRRFYGDLAQLEEVSGDEAKLSRICFRSEGIELRLRFVEEPDIDGVAVGATIAVASLEAVEETLREQKRLVERFRGIGGTDLRLHTLDPSGNRVEFKAEPHWAPF